MGILYKVPSLQPHLIYSSEGMQFQFPLMRIYCTAIMITVNEWYSPKQQYQQHPLSMQLIVILTVMYNIRELYY